MSDPTFVEGWNKSDFMADIRRSRAEIELIHMFNENHKEGVIDSKSLISLTIDALAARYNFKTDVEFVKKRLDSLVKVKDLERDAQDQEMIRMPQ